MSGPEGKREWLRRLPELLMDVILLGFFWTLTSLGIITVGASTAALNESMRSCLTDKGTNPIKTYFAAFKTYFRVSTLVWLVHLLILAVLVVDLLFYSVGDGFADTIALSAICVLLTMLVFEMSVVFACIVQFKTSTVKKSFSRAFDFAFRCFRESLMMLFVAAAVLVAGIFLFRGILLFAMGIITYCNWRILPGAFLRYRGKTAESRKAAAELQTDENMTSQKKHG